MQLGEIIQIRIEDLIDDGRGFGRADGLAVFVKDALPGDIIKARVAKVKKNIAEAEIIEYIEMSPDRIQARCPYCKECGGCTMQELSYDAQLRLKEQQIRSKLERLAGIENPIVRPIIGAELLEGYRNKATFAVGPHGEVGFLKDKTHYVMDIEDCILQTEPAMAAAAALREFLAERTAGWKSNAVADSADTSAKHSGGAKSGRGGKSNGRSGKRMDGRTSCCGISQMIVKTAFSTGEVMVVLESENKEIAGIEHLVELLDDYIYSVNPEQNIIYSLESVSIICNNKCRTVAGKNTILEKVTGTDGQELQFEISPQSFYQVNPEQMIKLYAKALEYAQLEGRETVLDLYCGVGTIGIFAATAMNRKLAEGSAGDASVDALADEMGKVIGIESVKPAVIDANRNSVINGIINTRYICGKAEEELPGMMGLAKLYKYNEVNEVVEREPEIKLAKVDVAIVDPPRAGCEQALLEAVAAAEPERIVYVSCDPGTLARDIKRLSELGYEFREATAVDMFPWTKHVETVALLSKVSE